jgi:mono/diheme cytochrome c family protein
VGGVRKFVRSAVGLAVLLAFWWPVLGQAQRATTSSAERGKYIFDAGGCFACHTDEKNGLPPLAGGPPLKTPFGTFFAPNITSDPSNGIGGWSEDQFVTAMQRGVSPDGKHYYPVFPYTSYTKAKRQDLLDLFAYLRSVPPAGRPSRAHEVGFPFSIRLTLLPWKWLNFSKGELQPDGSRDAVWNRGAYLTEALLHCGECHTPRNIVGGLDRAKWMAGTRLDGSGNVAPNLTPHASGLQKWSAADIAGALFDGTTPDGGFLGNEMGEVVRYATSRLTLEDRQAVARYFKDLPPLSSSVPPAKK